MNSWNRSTSYANDVKVPNLDIPSELQDLAYDVASGEVEAPDWDIFFARTVSDFDRTCDRLREGFIFMLEHYTPGEYTEVKRIPHRVMEPTGKSLLA